MDKLFEYFVNQNGYVFISDMIYSQVSSIDAQEGTITVDGILFDFIEQCSAEEYMWEGQNSQTGEYYILISSSSTPQIGDDVKYASENSYYYVSEERNPNVGDSFDDGNSNVITVKSIQDREEGQLINKISYNKEDYSKKPLTFKIISGGTIVWSYNGNSADAKNIQYSINGSEWYETDSSYYEIYVNDGDVVQFKGYNDSYGDCSTWYCHGFGNSSSVYFEVEGSIMSLIDGDDYKSLTSVNEGAFMYMFSYCTGLTSVENLSLPATTLANNCYASMFSDCTGLTTAPSVLPATTLAENCYGGMFYNCSSLTTAPVLPATTLADACYNCMFQGCSGLTTAPELPATTLAEGCYNSMFYECSGLTTAPELPATTLTDDCYDSMFYNCTSLTQAPALPATSLTPYCYAGMFAGCVNLTTAPELPATTLEEGCYVAMFNGDYNLNYIKCLATDISAYYSTNYWIYGVAQTGTFVKSPEMEDWEQPGEYNNGIPYGWTVQDDGLTLSKNGVGLYESGGSDTITVYSPIGNWTATTNDAWITLSTMTGGTGETTVTVSVSSTQSARTGNVTFTDGSIVISFIVAQDDDKLVPLTFNIMAGGSINWCYNGWESSYAKTIEYKLNDDDWVSINSNNNAQIYVESGDTVQFRGNNKSYCYVYDDGEYTNYFTNYFNTENAIFDVYGNIMSLIDGNSYAGLTSFEGNNNFNGLFGWCYGLNSAENLILPVTTLTEGCYGQMFYGCSYLLAAPELPATTLAQDCYNSMFGNCASLTTPPELPVTTLAVRCYYNMFEYCTSLVTAPELPATTLAEGCYMNMFVGCSSLEEAPVLCATTLVDSCYNQMFCDCSSLNYIKCLATDISANYCTEYWVSNVGQTGTFIKAESMTDWEVDSVNGIPYGWEERTSDPLKISKNSIVLYTSGGSGTVIITSPSSAWTASTNDSWISFSQSTGTTGQTELTITAQQGSSTRSGVATITDGDKTLQITVSQNDAYMKPLTFNITTSGKIYWNPNGLINLEYKLNNSDWAAFDDEYVTVNANDILQFRGNNNSLNYSAFGSEDAMFSVDGNIMSLLSENDYPSLNNLKSNAFSSLFGGGCTGLTSAENLLLPATTLAQGCYSDMFYGCTSLTTAPELPSTTLAVQCYRDMFYNCTSLTTAPELPATTLASNCYQYMFYGCTSLTTAPELPATLFEPWCYGSMFYGCSNLNYIKCLASGASSNVDYIYQCTDNWVNGVADSGLFVKNPNMSGWTVGNNGIPEGWETDVRDVMTISKSCDGFYESGGSSSIVVASPNYAWTATTNDAWITLSTMTGGTGETTVTISVGSTQSAKMGSVSFTGGDKTRILTIYQNDNYFIPLTFDIISGGTLYWKASYDSNAASKTIEYRINSGNWNTITSRYTSAPTISVQAGDVVEFRGDNNSYTSSGNTSYYSQFSGNTLFNVKGNIMSLIKKEDFIKANKISKNFALQQLFKSCNGLISAENLLLPATTLANYCYGEMLWGCSGLTTAPSILPATTLASQCYIAMFANCTSLTTGPSSIGASDTVMVASACSQMFSSCRSLTAAPALPATTLAEGCYSYMFQGCSSLTTAPALPATTLTNSCYYYMFYNCTSLTTAPALPATTLADYCYGSMFNGCTSLTTAPSILPATTLTNNCYYYMFNDCTSLTAAPSLPATTLAQNCYSNMFANCTGLTTAPELPATTLAQNCYSNMFASCTSLTTAPSLPATTLAQSCYQAMFYNCTGLTTAPSLPATTLAQSCYSDMFSYCTSLTTAPELPATTLATQCYQSMFNRCSGLTTGPSSIGTSATIMAASACTTMFNGCTSLTTAPALPATTLAFWCYYKMFYDCTSLVQAPELPATSLTYGCYYQMFQNCSLLEEAPELPASALTTYCYYCMFSGCSNLNYINCLATNTAATQCTLNWVNGVSDFGIFVKSPNMNNWGTGTGGIPVGWESNNSDVLRLSTYQIQETQENVNTNVKVNSPNAVWTATTNDAWITLSTMTGDTGETIITVSLSQSSDAREGQVSFTDGNKTRVLRVIQNDNLAIPLTFDIISGGTLIFTRNNNQATAKYIQYKLNDNDWITINSNGYPNNQITVQDGDVIQFIGTNDAYCTNTYYNYYSYFSGSTNLKWNVRGNINSLINSTNYKAIRKLPNNGTFAFLFYGCKGIISAENLILPATKLAAYCYCSMFKECTSMTSAPKSIGYSNTVMSTSSCTAMFSSCASIEHTPALPSTNLSYACYSMMFFGCSGLTTVPELPATTLANDCYLQMFKGCNSLSAANITIGNSSTVMKISACTEMFANCIGLTTAPALPALSLSGCSYSRMFSGCTALTEAPSLPATRIASGCYYGMFQGCTSLVSTPALVSTASSDSCYMFMFANCTGLLSAQTISATEMSGYSCVQMFSGCTSLVYAPALPATKLGTNCYSGMFNCCYSLKNAPNLPATTLGTNCYNSMFNMCSGLTTGPLSIGASNTQIPISACCYMFKDCKSLTAAPALPATSLNTACYYYMFNGCTSLVTAPSLPATTLAPNCYCNMFRNCTNLTTGPSSIGSSMAASACTGMFMYCSSLATAPALPATTVKSYCYASMFYNCTSLTTAPDLPAATLTSYCYTSMFQGCSNLNYVKCLAKTKSATNCTTSWMTNVAASGTFVKDASTTWATGTNGIPTGWTVEDAS